MVPESLGVIGLGAIGGSIASRAVRFGVPSVIGYAASARDRSMAARAGGVTDIAHGPEQVVDRVEMLVLAAPPGPTVELVARVAERVRQRGVLCTDVASVKRAVTEAAQAAGLGPHFAGSHPLAGSHRTGFAAADPDRFDGARVYVTPIPEGERAAREVADFWERVCGADTVTIDAGAHDELLSWTSHLPQAVASALARAFAEAGPAGATLGPGGRDTTRIAASDGEAWTEILLANRDAVLARLTDVDAALAELRTALERGDRAALDAWLGSASRWRRSLDA
jgi:prephenate dehydrogenase